MHMWIRMSWRADAAIGRSDIADNLGWRWPVVNRRVSLRQSIPAMSLRA
jgi:hypothetical protein